MSTVTSEGTLLTYRDALRQALVEEMERDERVILLGEDVGRYGGAYAVSRGLLEHFGEQRVIDTPMSEALIVGAALGAAVVGGRPIAEIMYMDFATLIMDQLVNQAAKMHYMFGGQLDAPLVVRVQQGTGRGAGSQHSQSLESWFTHVPGLKVVAPSTPGDAKGLMRAAIRDDDPVVFFESRSSYNVKGAVPDGEHVVPLGRAAIAREGDDASIVAVGAMVGVALRAADALAADGIGVEVVDVRSLVPLDTATIVASVKKTSRALVLDAGHAQFGVAGEIAATIAEQAFDWLDAPVLRLAAPNAPIPFSRTLEPLAIPSRQQVVAKVRELVGKR
jgi:pyruvate/2-oxoglutarate/acetoin dehydrogenase E1 component